MNILPAEVIKKKRNKQVLTKTEISEFILGYTNGKIPDYQMSALLMSIYFNSLNKEEIFSLTDVMMKSGSIVDLGFINKFKVDKHSTGGVGDKTSLILGPIVAACGYPVPMISGRGLGHSGGTLDKLESIPGFNTQFSLKDFAKMVEQNLICFIGQTAEICPADKKIYALRDVTATVESIPLICASIMSKKLAEGIDGLVLDVKFGSGAFMKTLADAETLARQLVEVAVVGGKKCRALLTNMNQPLGRFAGNSLEIQECLQILKNEIPSSAESRFYQDTLELSIALSAHMVQLAEPSWSFEICKSKCIEVLSNGKAYEVFERTCKLQGGNLNQLPLPNKKFEVKSLSEGLVSEFNTEKIGVAGILLKAGRAKSDDKINPVSGIEFHKKIGDMVSKNETLFTLYSDTEKDFESVEKFILESVKLESDNNKIQKFNLIEKII